MKIKDVRSPHALCPILSDLGVRYFARLTQTRCAGVRCIVREEMNLERWQNDNRYVHEIIEFGRTTN